ncbi:ubiquinol-cytochrome C chaperone family protein [Sphingomonas sp. KR1UV-12]|uniref:Ubiquinol-cytochrome C chaperone family protein n=1 Tax=Sphingomonas aurea TaxID=3063994 RepID=A0ABT9ENS0_9SPHN|nr:ubiquinol-cytochrome C chaperone family protein [Sphingomonas sp. KR1UV-12]MDP1028601.1 ubiquinol-cytochrome C chaperone family protein [Sphingomonas sp. KR1UV-12]
MGWLQSLWGKKRDEAWLPLYNAVVLRARAEYWYLAGAVPDTVDGRFDMIAAVLSMVLLRLEGEADGAAPAAHLTEHFVDDMDAQLRQIGIGDITVGKHVGKMMAALGGRLGAYRDAFAGPGEPLETALARNLYRGQPPADTAVAHVADALRALRAGLADTPLDALRQGMLP